MNKSITVAVYQHFIEKALFAPAAEKTDNLFIFSYLQTVLTRFLKLALSFLNRDFFARYLENLMTYQQPFHKKRCGPHKQDATLLYL